MGFITGASYATNTVNPYKLLHDSEWILCTFVVVIRKIGYLLFSAYTVPVERHFQESGVALLSLHRVDVVNSSPTSC